VCRWWYGELLTYERSKDNLAPAISIRATLIWVSSTQVTVHYFLPGPPLPCQLHSIFTLSCSLKHDATKPHHYWPNCMLQIPEALLTIMTQCYPNRNHISAIHRWYGLETSLLFGWLAGIQWHLAGIWNLVNYLFLFNITILCTSRTHSRHNKIKMKKLTTAALFYDGWNPLEKRPLFTCLVSGTLGDFTFWLDLS